MNQKEKELFLELCAFRSPNAKKIEGLLKSNAATAEVLGMLFANRMAGVAYHVLKETSLLDLVDREFRNSLHNAFWLNEKINDDFLGCIKFLSTELEACGVPYALLKGAYLCFKYPSGCRTSNDVDVLIAPQDVGKVSAKLKMAGFRQGYLKNGTFFPASRKQIIESKMTRGETVPFIKETKLPFLKYIEVDLNFSLDYKNSDDEVLKQMLSRTQLVSISGTQIRTLDNTDFFLHLCSHLYKEATTLPWIQMGRDMTFYKYADLYLLMEQVNDEEATRLYFMATGMNLETELSYCLHSLQSFWELKDASTNSYLHGRYNWDLHRVFSPAEKKVYRYTEKNVKTRFFKKDRQTLLEEE